MPEAICLWHPDGSIGRAATLKTGLVGRWDKSDDAHDSAGPLKLDGELINDKATLVNGGSVVGFPGGQTKFARITVNLNHCCAWQVVF